MSRPIIRRLSNHVVDLIAAGEVVERPAAALKELVENALDAGATQIEITLCEGGCDFIEVRDNGCGMTKEELSLAVERHCTSKLQNDDLIHIKSLGFRGEALPSIAATARLSIISRIEGADTAWQLKVEGGVSTPIIPAAGEVGTCVCVRDLFFATPARRKFLKSARIESGHAEAVIKRLALSAPQCAFDFKLDNRVVFSVPSQELKERVGAILSVSPNSLIEVDEQRGDMRLTGFLCGPAQTRRTGSGQYMLVNQRPVSDPMLKTALRVAYRPVIERGRFPLLYLHLSLPFERVDVNVHPAKTELRFSQEGEVKSLIIGAVGRALARGVSEAGSVNPALEPFLKKQYSYLGKAERSVIKEEERNSHNFERDLGFAPSMRRAPIDEIIEQEKLRKYYDVASYDGFDGMAETRASYKSSYDHKGVIEDVFLEEKAQERALEEPNISPKERISTVFDGAKGILGTPIMQLYNTYILSIGPDGELILIDQHAAHERLTHEYLRDRLEKGAFIGQSLLTPHVVDLSVREAELLVEAQEELKYLGLEIESFGQETILIRSVPAVLKNEDYTALLKDIAEELSEDPSLSIRQTESFDQRLEALVARMACHGSIRAGRVLKLEEMDALLRDMEKYPRTNTCPHGRPTWLRLNRDALEKLFGRVK